MTTYSTFTRAQTHPNNPNIIPTSHKHAVVQHQTPARSIPSGDAKAELPIQLGTGLIRSSGGDRKRKTPTPTYSGALWVPGDGVSMGQKWIPELVDLSSVIDTLGHFPPSRIRFKDIQYFKVRGKPSKSSFGHNPHCELSTHKSSQAPSTIPTAHHLTSPMPSLWHPYAASISFPCSTLQAASSPAAVSTHGSPPD